MVREKGRKNPAIVWRKFEGDHPCDLMLGYEDEVFLSWFYFDGVAHTAPFLTSGPGGRPPTPTQWANAVVDMWNALFRQDKPAFGFERLSISAGEIRLDGELVIKVPLEGQLYEALKYMVGRLQEDPTATFRNDEVKDVVGSDGSKFSISKLISPSKPSALHRKLAAVIRTLVVQGDDGWSAVTLHELPELKAFWRSVDPAIEGVLRPSQQEN
jgi:hypothetical protein